MLPITKSLDVQEHEEVVDGSYVPDPPPKFVLPWQPCCPRTPGGPASALIGRPSMYATLGFFGIASVCSCETSASFWVSMAKRRCRFVALSSVRKPQMLG